MGIGNFGGMNVVVDNRSRHKQVLHKNWCIQDRTKKSYCQTIFILKKHVLYSLSRKFKIQQKALFCVFLIQGYVLVCHQDLFRRKAKAEEKKT